LPGPSRASEWHFRALGALATHDPLLVPLSKKAHIQRVAPFLGRVRARRTSSARSRRPREDTGGGSSVGRFFCRFFWRFFWARSSPKGTDDDDDNDEEEGEDEDEGADGEVEEEEEEEEEEERDASAAWWRASP